jgi:hypothetical protein
LRRRGFRSGGSKIGMIWVEAQGDNPAMIECWQSPSGAT